MTFWPGVNPQNSLCETLYVTLRVDSGDCSHPVCVLGCNQIWLIVFSVGKGPALYLPFLSFPGQAWQLENAPRATQEGAEERQALAVCFPAALMPPQPGPGSPGFPLVVSEPLLSPGPGSRSCSITSGPLLRPCLPNAVGIFLKPVTSLSGSFN